MIPAEKAERSPFVWPAEKDSAVQKSAANDVTSANMGRVLSSNRPLTAIPLNVWARLVVLFLALAGIKLGLIVLLGKQIFEAHWRVTPHEPVWGDYLLFGFFVMIGFVSLLRLQRGCALAGISAVRAANAIVLSLGLVFIFLTFQAQGKNYLFPILSGVLNWDSLISYLSLNLFFQAPYLGGWIFAYALSYYLLARNGRESLVLYLTAGFGMAYAAVGLQALAISRNELVALSGLAVASLVAGQPSRGGARMFWLFAPIIWCVFFALELLRLAPRELGLPFTYFSLLLYASVILFGGATLIAYRRGFGASWSPLAFFYFPAFLLLANRNYPGAVHFNNVICLGFEFPRYFVGEVGIVGLAGAYAMVIRVVQSWLYRRGATPSNSNGGKTVKTVEIASENFTTSLKRRVNERGIVYAAIAFLLLGLIGLLTANADKAQGQSSLRLVETSRIWKRATNRILRPEE